MITYNIRTSATDPRPVLFIDGVISQATDAILNPFYSGTVLATLSSGSTVSLGFFNASPSITNFNTASTIQFTVVRIG